MKHKRALIFCLRIPLIVAITTLAANEINQLGQALTNVQESKSRAMMDGKNTLPPLPPKPKKAEQKPAQKVVPKNAPQTQKIAAEKKIPKTFQEEIQSKPQLKKITPETLRQENRAQFFSDINKVDSSFAQKLGHAQFEELVNFAVAGDDKERKNVRNFLLHEQQFRNDLLDKEIFDRLIHGKAADVEEFIKTVNDIYDSGKDGVSRSLLKNVLLQQKVLFPYVDIESPEEPVDDDWD